MVGNSYLRGLVTACLLFVFGLSVAHGHERKEVTVLFTEEQEIFIMGLTVAMEAEGETYEGKLAVAFVIRNRADLRGMSILDTCLNPHAFSVWDSIGGRRTAINRMSKRVMADAMAAALNAYYRYTMDPSKGATHFLNEDATRTKRGGTLPWWTRQLERVTKVGNHTFYRERGRGK